MEKYQNETYGQFSSLDELSEAGYAFGEKDAVDYSRLIEVLKEKGISISDLSELTGISRQALHSIVKKKKQRIGIDIALKLSYVLGTRVEELFNVNQEVWYNLVADTQDMAIYLDHLTLCLVNNQTRKRIEDEVGNDTMVNIKTKETKSAKLMTTEEKTSDDWHPRFERLLKKIKPIQL